jgi:transcriptional regulator with XRE-family HTH domain
MADIMNMDRSAAWLREMAGEEANVVVSVGALGAELAHARARRPDGERPLNRTVLATLVEFRRRSLGMGVEQLAGAAGVGLAELLAIESGAEPSPEGRTMVNLAQVLGLPPQKLMHLSGLTSVRDRRFDDAAVRFAARSKPVDALSDEQREAMDELVKVMVEP